MERIQTLFDRMDSWRNLPNYQLERRADLFFSLYLPVALEEKLGLPICPVLVPEFPLLKDVVAVKPNGEEGSRKSVKVDYLAISKDLRTPIFVELKTDIRSRNTKQDAYLATAQDTAFENLLRGLISIFRVSRAKKKYFRLFELLEEMGVVSLPDELRHAMQSPSHRGASKSLDGIKIAPSGFDKSHVIYLQPTGAGDHTMSFREFSHVVDRFTDPLSRRFSESLARWAQTVAGEGAAYRNSA